MHPSSENSLPSPVPSNTSTLRERGSSIIEQGLASSTEEILKSCDRFRILVVGKSGAGKSSLINATFGIHIANVSHEMSGISNIYQEITSEQNTRFILHDSQGFAAGETQNYTTVEKFIAEKAKEPKLKDRLHAIWFCMEVPTENGALFEKADDAFLQLDLQSIPVVVVFTKYDLLVRKFEKEADASIGKEEMETMANQKADEFYDKNCVRPLKNITRNRPVPISYVRVSTKQDVYTDTLVKLVEETQSRLDERLWILWALAQRVSVDAKIGASIKVGRKTYWHSLGTSLHFLGKTMEQCLDRIHDDMVDIWNFNDPGLKLKSPGFKKAIALLVEDLGKERNSTVATQMISFSGAYGVITTILPIAPHVALPAAAAVAAAQWLLHFYLKESPNIIRLLMGYICDLTNVLQCIFWIMHGRGDAIEVDQALIDLAIKEHEDTHARSLIHAEIWTFVKPSNLFRTNQKDEAMEKLSDILQNVRFKPENLSQSPKLSMSLLESKVFSFDQFPCEFAS